MRALDLSDLPFEKYYIFFRLALILKNIYNTHLNKTLYVVPFLCHDHL